MDVRKAETRTNKQISEKATSWRLVAEGGSLISPLDVEQPRNPRPGIELSGPPQPLLLPNWGLSRICHACSYSISEADWRGAKAMHRPLCAPPIESSEERLPVQMWQLNLNIRLAQLLQRYQGIYHLLQ